MDEREIEAVAEALWRNNRLDGKPNTYPYDHLMGLTRADLRRLALAAIAALDRVRDTRGDDVDRQASHREQTIAEMDAARSPQDEDHEHNTNERDEDHDA
jgi:hypothetical protein